MYMYDLVPEVLLLSHDLCTTLPQNSTFMRDTKEKRTRELLPSSTATNFSSEKPHWLISSLPQSTLYPNKKTSVERPVRRRHKHTIPLSPQFRSSPHQPYASAHSLVFSFWLMLPKGRNATHWRQGDSKSVEVCLGKYFSYSKNIPNRLRGVHSSGLATHYGSKNVPLLE